MDQKIDLSIITPVFNEEQNLNELIKKLILVLEKTKQAWEIIAVNDGSDDKSAKILNSLAKKVKQLKVIHFSRNFGQTAAIAAGVKYSRGKIIILIDSDLQNDPNDIPKLLNKLNEGFDLVSGWRKNRKDSFIRTIPSIIANKIISRATGVNLHDTGCTLKAYQKDIFTNFNLYGEMHRFLPSIAASYGAKIAEIEVKHYPRKYGKSKYTLLRTLKVLLDLLTVKFFGSYSTKPIYVFGGSGFVLLLLGFFATGFVIVRKVFFNGEWVSPMLFIAILLIAVSFQLILMGLLAEIMIRTYFESSKRSIYKIRKKVNIN